MEEILKRIAVDLPASTIIAIILISLSRMFVSVLKEIVAAQTAIVDSVDKLKEGLEISRKLDDILREVSKHEEGPNTHPRPK